MEHHDLKGAPRVRVHLRRSARARRMSLRVSRLDGLVTLTLPRGMPLRAAIAFAEEKSKAKTEDAEVIDEGDVLEEDDTDVDLGDDVLEEDDEDSVSLDDIRKVAVPVLRHRISTNFQAQAEGFSPDDLITRLVKEVREPDVPKYDRRGGAA